MARLHPTIYGHLLSEHVSVVHPFPTRLVLLTFQSSTSRDTQMWSTCKRECRQFLQKILLQKKASTKYGIRGTKITTANFSDRPLQMPRDCNLQLPRLNSWCELDSSLVRYPRAKDSFLAILSFNLGTFVITIPNLHSIKLGKRGNLNS